MTDNIPESQRIKPDILAKFLPGYLYQQEFASTYKPEAILLSVGGDDIGFAGIVKSCVANIGGGTCYDTYEDRAELVNEIDNTYSELVTTYKTLRQQSGGARIYVVGYPQVAEPGGDCGLNVHLNSDELTFASQLISYLDGVVQKAAATAGVSYVDTENAFDGHRLCEAGAKAINGLTAGSDTMGITIHGKTFNLIGAESYHPTPLGYRLLAQTIAARTDDLAAPMPAAAPYAVPVFDPLQPILQGVKITGRPISWVTNDDTIADDFVFRGDTQQVTVDGSEVQLQPGSEYQVVLHSNPTLLDEGGVDAAGDISATVRIPADTAPGFHTLHVYGKDMAGDTVDVQKVIYVAASADDFDGDGVPNSADACLIVPLSGQDADRDGADDACDPEISADVTITGEVSTEINTAGVPAAAPALTGSGRDTAGQKSVTVAGKVLGDSTSAAPAGPTRDSAIGTAVPAKVFRLDWRPTIYAGIGLATLITLLYTAFSRRG